MHSIEFQDKDQVFAIITMTTNTLLYYKERIEAQEFEIKKLEESYEQATNVASANIEQALKTLKGRCGHLLVAARQLVTSLNGTETVRLAGDDPMPDGRFAALKRITNEVGVLLNPEIEPE